MGLTLVPAALSDVKSPEVNLPEESLEELARSEHDRWVEDHERRGWRPTTGPKDVGRKLHKLAVAVEGEVSAQPPCPRRPPNPVPSDRQLDRR